MKDISLNHRYDAIQWYESIPKHGDTWVVLISTSPTLSKVIPMWDGWKRQFISSDMMSKRLYTSKLIAKILNAKTMFGSECSSFRLIVRAARNGGYTAFYSTMRPVHPILMD